MWRCIEYGDWEFTRIGASQDFDERSTHLNSFVEFVRCLLESSIRQIIRRFALAEEAISSVCGAEHINIIIRTCFHGLAFIFPRNLHFKLMSDMVGEQSSCFEWSIKFNYASTKEQR